MGKTDVAVVGAGLAGLTAALRLTQAGHKVQVFERYPRPGGLARVMEVGGEPLEAFYHHLFTSDTSYIALAEELGVADLIDWLPSRMGIWTDGRLWDFGTPQSLLRFRPLSFLDKMRFAMSTLLLQRSKDPTRFENVTASEWIRRHQGQRVGAQGAAAQARIRELEEALAASESRLLRAASLRSDLSAFWTAPISAARIPSIMRK